MSINPVHHWQSCLARAPRWMRIRYAMPLLLVLPMTACALEPFNDDGVTKRAASLVNVASPVGEPAAFVKEQRPDGKLTYIPVGVTPPQRQHDIRGAAGAAALEAELDAERKAAQTFATRAAPSATYDGTKPPPVKPPPKELMPQ